MMAGAEARAGGAEGGVRGAARVAARRVLPAAVMLAFILGTVHCLAREDVAGALVFLACFAFAVAAAAGPYHALCFLLAFAFVNPSYIPPLAEIGGISFRVIDLAFILVLLRVLVKRLREGAIPVPAEFTRVFLPFAPLFACIALSTAVGSGVEPGRLADAAASGLRLLSTVGIGFLILSSVESPAQVRGLLVFLASFGAASVGVGFAEAVVRHPDALQLRRIGGLVGVNSLGLLSGLLLLFAAFGLGRPRPGKAAAVSAAGLVGLALSRAASPMLAAAAALSLHAFRRFGRSPTPLRLSALIVAALALVAVLYASLAFLRGSDLGALAAMRGGSFAQRAMLFYAGILIFAGHPLLGVGWTASGSAGVLGSPDLNANLMEAFPGLSAGYFFSTKTTSLHNLYVQLLAELGLAGFLCFALGAWKSGTALWTMREGVSPALRPQFRYCAYALAFLLVWWNSNPLYGGQPESILAVTFIALMAKMAELGRREKEADETGAELASAGGPPTHAATQNSSATIDNR